MFTRRSFPTVQAYPAVLAPKAVLNRPKNQPRVLFNSQVSGSGRVPCGRSRMAASAGLSVSELMAEKTVDTEIVTANWRKNRPVMPLIKAHGTNTAHSTRATAITGPVTSSIAFRAASRDDKPWASQRWTFSTTTMASSTTMPMASTKPNSEMLFRLKPTTAITAKVPTMATGTATMGISTVRQFCKKTNTTSPTNSTASSKVSTTSAIDSRTKGVMS